MWIYVNYTVLKTNQLCIKSKEKKNSIKIIQIQFILKIFCGFNDFIRKDQVQLKKLGFFFKYFQMPFI